MIYMLKYLPNEIVRYIQQYLYVKCDECDQYELPSSGLSNVTTIYYRAIFNDDFTFPRIYKTHPVLCKNCIEKLKKEFIKPL